MIKDPEAIAFPDKLEYFGEELWLSFLVDLIGYKRGEKVNIFTTPSRATHVSDRAFLSQKLLCRLLPQSFIQLKHYLRKNDGIQVVGR